MTGNGYLQHDPVTARRYRSRVALLHQRECAGPDCTCRFLVLGRQPRRFCSARCRMRAFRQATRPPDWRIGCEQCGAIFTAIRADARYCSTRCRVAAHRARQRETSSATVPRPPELWTRLDVPPPPRPPV